MHFKLEYTIRELALPSEESLLFDVHGPHHVEVLIRSPNEQEQEIGYKTQHAFCTSQVELNVSAKNQEVFDKIEKNEIIVDNDKWAQKYKDQNENEIILPSLEKFPEYFKEFLRQVNMELSNASRLVINAIRWRTNMIGPHNPISTKGLFWSRDKVFWNPSPASYSLILLDSASILRIREREKEDIKYILNEKLQEPVHHELFREAWELRHGSPRSSLITGLAALEVAIKVTIASLIPGTTWLVEHVPSPPINRLLSEYLPNLPVANTINGRVLSPPKQVVELIKKAVTIRNQIAHIGGKPPDHQTLAQVLDAIRDAIWLLDYYSGYVWAYDHISKETKQLLENQ